MAADVFLCVLMSLFSADLGQLLPPTVTENIACIPLRVSFLWFCYRNIHMADLTNRGVNHFCSLAFARQSRTGLFAACYIPTYLQLWLVERNRLFRRRLLRRNNHQFLVIFYVVFNVFIAFTFNILMSQVQPQMCGYGTSNRVYLNQHTRELINAPNTSHKHNKDSSRLR